MSADDVNFFFEMRSQIKLFHWQTTSFAMHKATDGVIESLDENIDKYVEVYMGKYGRPRVTAKNASTSIGNLSPKAMVAFVKATIGHLQVGLVQKLKPSDTDLMNIRDEMLGDLNQLLYLFTLN